MSITEVEQQQLLIGGEWGNAQDTPVVPGTPKGQPPKAEETK